MISHADDKKLFYKLVNGQRNHGQPTISELIIDDVHVSDSDRIRQCWASYFENLATPVEDSNFDGSYKVDTELKRLLIQNIDRLENSSAEEITLRRARKTINSMKNNKAADMSGLTAEHVKYGCDVLTE